MLAKIAHAEFMGNKISKATKQGQAAAKRAGKRIGHPNPVKARDALATKMTPDKVAEAQRLAGEWKPTK